MLEDFRLLCILAGVVDVDVFGLGLLIVFVGDEDQLPSIEAGQACGLMKRSGMAFATMDEIKRQRDPMTLKAVQDTVRRNHHGALDKLKGNIVSISERKERLQAVANAYLDLSAKERDEALVLTPSNADRVELAERIRQGLRREGVLRGDETQASVLVSSSFTEAQVRVAAYYAEEDIVRFGRTYRRLGVERGSTWRVVETKLPTNEVILQNEDGRKVSWTPDRYVHAEVYRQEQRGLAAGDRIRWTRNAHDLGRRNGDQAEVVSISDDGSTALVAMNTKVGVVEQALDLKPQRHWDHAWAVTAHAAQGATRDRAFVHIDTSERNLLGHQQWYVSISRARESVHVFTDNEDALPLRIKRSMEQDSALDARSRSRSQTNTKNHRYPTQERVLEHPSQPPSHPPPEQP